MFLLGPVESIAPARSLFYARLLAAVSASCFQKHFLFFLLFFVCSLGAIAAVPLHPSKFK